MDYPSQFESDVPLSDGRRVHLRPIRSDDADREHEFFLRVGQESAYYRFFSPKPDLSPEELKYFTTVDYDNRMAFVAIHCDAMVAVGRYDVVTEKTRPNHKVAEIALLVEDDFQRCGVGSALLRRLAAYARLRGITGFEAYALAENRAVKRLLARSGLKVRHILEEGVYQIEFPISAALGQG